MCVCLCMHICTLAFIHVLRCHVNTVAFKHALLISASSFDIALFVLTNMATWRADKSGWEFWQCCLCAGHKLHNDLMHILRKAPATNQAHATQAASTLLFGNKLDDGGLAIMVLAFDYTRSSFFLETTCNTHGMVYITTTDTETHSYMQCIIMLQQDHSGS